MLPCWASPATVERDRGEPPTSGSCTSAFTPNLLLEDAHSFVDAQNVRKTVSVLVLVRSALPTEVQKEQEV
eukprot:4536117-Amphidinium_carterae.1